MKIAINRFSSRAGKKKRFNVASNVRQTIESVLYHHRENLHFVVIPIGVISYPCNLRHGVETSLVKRQGTLMRHNLSVVYEKSQKQFISRTCQESSWIRARNFQKFNSRLNLFVVRIIFDVRFSSIAIILNE